MTARPLLLALLAAVWTLAAACSPGDNAAGGAGAAGAASADRTSVAEGADAERSDVEPRGAREGSGGARAVSGDARAVSGDARRSSGDAPLVLFLGTSLTEGLGLEDPGSEAWPARIGALAREDGFDLAIRNAGLSGETSAGARRRLDWVLDAPPTVFVLETGANDGLRGLSVEELEANLDAIFRDVRSAVPGVRLVLAGMEAPTNLGAAYTEPFRAVFPRVADRWDAELIPFLLAGVAGEPELNQPDRIHPTAAGHARMAETAWPVIRQALEGT